MKQKVSSDGLFFETLLLYPNNSKSFFFVLIIFVLLYNLNKIR